MILTVDDVYFCRNEEKMIASLAVKIYGFVEQNIGSTQIDENSKPVYLYGIELCISTVLNILIIVATGAFMNSFVESIVFLACFIPIRQYTGGYHAKNYFMCNTIFVLTFMCIHLLSMYTIQLVNVKMAMICAVMTFICVILLAPIKNPHKRISEKLRIKSKFISVILWILFSVVSICLISYGSLYGVVILYTLLAIVVLMIIGKFKEKGDFNNEQEKNS